MNELEDYTGAIGTAGEEVATREALPEYTGGANFVLAASNDLLEYKDGVNGIDGAINELPEYIGGVNAVESLVHDIDNDADVSIERNEESLVVASLNTDTNNKKSKYEDAPNKDQKSSNSYHIFKNVTGNVQIQASAEVLNSDTTIKVEEVRVSALESLQYRAFDIRLNDINGNNAQPNGNVIVIFAENRTVEHVYYVDPEGNLHALEFMQKDGKVIFETNHFSIYAMTFQLAVNNSKYSNLENNNTDEVVTVSLKSDSTTRNVELSQEDKKMINNKQSILPNTGERTSILTMFFGFIGIILGLIGFYKPEDN